MENKHIEIIPTCVPSSQEDIDEANAVASRFGDSLHIDINDGVFARPRTWPDNDESVTLPTLSTHIHLMVDDAKTYGDIFALAKAHSIIVHAESFGVLELLPDLIIAWKKRGVKEVGVAFLIKSDVSSMIHHEALQLVDFVLCMSVEHIGEQGAEFETAVMEHIRTVVTALPNTPIAVDGGISNENIGDLVSAGASRFYVGSSIMRAPDPHGAYNTLLHTAKSALQ
jgi:ribulose-phosphate 3-epimerase